MTLFPRHTEKKNRWLMKRCLAHQILDRLRRGDDVSPGRVAWALRITGDAA